MAKKLTSKCKDMQYAISLRAEQQLKEAYRLLKEQGKLNTFTAIGSDGKHLEWNDCISSHCFVVRYDGDSKCLVYHCHHETWAAVWACRDDKFNDMCECADFLLEKAYNPGKYKF